MTGGECLLCKHISNCSETSLERVETSYVCGMFSSVPEAVFLARLETAKKFGERMMIFSLLPKTDAEGEPRNVIPD